MLRKNLVVRKNFVPLHPQLSNKGVADTGCSAVGSVPGLGPGCRRFESCHPDEERIIQVILSFFVYCNFVRVTAAYDAPRSEIPPKTSKRHN